jgi:unsaturated rhamnogalacturonyl hydrolase
MMLKARQLWYDADYPQRQILTTEPNEKAMITTSLNAAPTDTSWAVRMTASMLPNYPPKKWKWHYEDGLFVKALSGIGAATGDESFERFAQDWADHFVTPQGDILTYQASELNLDLVNPGKLLFPLYRRTADERYAKAIQLLRSQLQQQPRTQMWLDGLYMASPFYAEYALTFHEEELLTDVTHQFKLIEEHTRDPHTGLLYHGWDESKTQRWANPDTGCSPHFWGRALGWYMMALVDTLDLLPESHADQPALVQILTRLASALLQVQDPATGLWYQVVDLPQRPGNYLETSVSAMLAYAFAKGVRQGYLPVVYQLAAQRAFRGLLEHKVKVDAHGVLTLEGICSVGGLGGIPYRDGSFEYYIGEPVVANDFKGVGSFILAALELEASEVKGDS